MGQYRLHHAEVADLPRYVAPGSVDLILTDPPYGKDAIPVYGRLAEAASVCLKPGGSLITMCGQSYLPELFELMTPHLHYQWMFASRLSGPGTAVWKQRVHNHWRAWLWFTSGAYQGPFQGDFLPDDTQDKRWHPWGQGISTFAHLIQRFTQPGDLVVDPCCGGGSVGKAALLLERRFLGLDLDLTAIAKTAERLDTISVSDTVQVPLTLPEPVGPIVVLNGVDGDVFYAPLDPQYLPDASGVYMVFHAQECLYVGQSLSLRKRWQPHNRLPELLAISKDLVIAWTLAPKSALLGLEYQLMMQLRPRLNRQRLATDPSIMSGPSTRGPKFASCRYCGRSFIVQRKSGQYCGDAHRQAWHRRQRRLVTPVA